MRREIQILRAASLKLRSVNEVEQGTDWYLTIIIIIIIITTTTTTTTIILLYSARMSKTSEALEDREH